MHDLGVNQYLYLLAAMAGAAVVGAVLGLLLTRRAARDTTPDHQDTGSTHVLPTFMMLLTALAVGAGVLLLIPAGMILRYFPHWQVAAMLIVAALLLTVPLVYAWRTRPF